MSSSRSSGRGAAGTIDFPDLADVGSGSDSSDAGSSTRRPPVAPRPAFTSKPAFKRALNGQSPARASGSGMDVDTPTKGAPALLSTPTTKLKYGIHSFSSFAASYHPKNILVNKPGDQSSRWSSAHNNHNQFVMVKLEKMAIIQTVTFGKFHKAHVCNLKEFRVYGGVSPDSMVELLHAGLRNDAEPETFSLKHKTDDVVRISY